MSSCMTAGDVFSTAIITQMCSSSSNICQGWCGCGMCAIIRVRFLELLFLFKYRCKMLDNGPFLYEHFICHAAVSLAEQHL